MGFWIEDNQEGLGITVIMVEARHGAGVAGLRPVMALNYGK